MSGIRIVKNKKDAAKVLKNIQKIRGKLDPLNEQLKIENEKLKAYLEKKKIKEFENDDGKIIYVAPSTIVWKQDKLSKFLKDSKVIKKARKANLIDPKESLVDKVFVETTTVTVNTTAIEDLLQSHVIPTEKAQRFYTLSQGTPYLRYYGNK